MRGFVVGSLALIALEVAIRRGDNAIAAFAAGNDLLTRFLSSAAAGVPDYAARKTGGEAGPAPTTNPTVAGFTGAPYMQAPTPVPESVRT